jgi:hypothetical protein
MKLHRLPTSAAMLALALVGCVSTDVASQIAPGFAGHRFGRTLIVADVGMLRERTVAEDVIADALTERRIDAVRSLDVVFAADTLPEEAFLDHAAKAGADAVLLLRVIDEGSDAHYVPPSASTTFTAVEHHGFVTGYASTTSFGGRTVLKPWARFRATLLETATGRTAWFADAECRGNADSSMRDLVEDVAEEVAAQLIADGVLKAAQRR